MKIQFFKKKWLVNFRQMSHMKVEPGTDRESPTDDSLIPIGIIQKKELIIDEEEMDEDQMTEAPPSPRIPPSPPSSPINQDNTESLAPPLIQSDPLNPPSPSSSQVPDKLDSTEVNQQLTENVEPVQNQSSSHRVRKTGANGLDAPEVIPQAARISKRRFTTAGNQVAETVSTFAQTRKRRMSVNTRSDTVLRTDSPSINDEHEPIRAKRKRVNDQPSETSKSVTKSKTSSESNVIPQNEQAKTQSAKKHSSHDKSISNSTSSANSIAVNNSSTVTTATASAATAAPATTATAAATPPQKSRRSSQKHRKKFTVPLTPITQFFNKSPSMKCDTCAETLTTRNELNFHRKSHAKKQCVKCRKRIDNDNPASIRGHMISCLLLNNQLPKDMLTHFLKVKVDLNRLTPTKIAQIQKTLTNESKQRRTDGSKTKEPTSKPVAANATKNVERSKEVESTQQTVKESQLAAEQVQNSNDESNDGRHGAKKTKSKKPSNKSSKSAHNESSDESTIKENISAKLNWIDEPSKDKLFSVRNFDCDAKVYREIRRLSEKGSSLDEMKLTNFVKRIKLLKQQANSGVALQEPNRKQQNESHTQVPVNPMNASNVAPRAPITQQQSSNTPSPHNGVSAPYAPHTPNGQFMLMVSNGVNGPPNGPSLPYAPHTPNIASTPMATASFVLNPMISTNESINATSNIGTTTPNAPNAPNAPALPQLLGLPQRVPFRNRAMSMHYSAAEYNPAHLTSARRQSVCDNVPPSNNPFAQQKQQMRQQRPYDHVSRNERPIVPRPYTTQGSQQERTQSQLQPGTPQSTPPPYMTKVHNSDLVLNAPAPQQQQQQPKTQQQQPPKTATQPLHTLKVLSVDDLNSRATNAIQPIQSNSTPNRIDSPNSTENNTNVNNNQKPVVQPVKRIRTKTTPLRAQSVHIEDDANITISVSLTKLGDDRAELSLTTNEYGKLNYDSLTEKRRSEVRSSLLKDNVWLKMLKHLIEIRPTSETLNLFQKILPKAQHDYFINELRRKWGYSLN